MTEHREGGAYTHPLLGDFFLAGSVSMTFLTVFYNKQTSLRETASFS